MNIRFLILIGLGLLLVSLASCGAQPTSDPVDPVTSVGHGAFIGADGEEFTPDAQFIEMAQEFYIDTLMKQAEAIPDPGELTRRSMQQTQREISNLVEDDILANALFIDWLIEKLQPDNTAHITSVNNALRWYYYLDILRNNPPDGNSWTKGIEPEAAKELEANGIPAVSFLRTESGGEEYIRECRAAGVPIPPPMYSAAWTFQGTVDNEFISEAGQTDLWVYTSSSPAGVCLALPRYFAGTGFSRAELFGLICLGTQSNNACFWDNPKGTFFPRDVEVDISEFVGGVDLVANGQGVCSDCHAGENPYVVHPEKPPFSGLTPDLMPLGWHNPLVDASWPHNPGPTNLLDATSSTGRCDSCHRVGSAGRFPDVSTELNGYCSVVLRTAAGTSSKRTMPPFGMDRNQFIAHIDALQTACGAPPTGGGVVVEADFPDDAGFISPPIVIDPLYQCATQVAVRGTILDAKVDLFINGSLVGTVDPARSPSRIEFSVPALVAGDVVTAMQEYNGVLSTSSAPITVRDHTVDFPGGLPAPEIDPTLIHACGDIIAVRHVPGATLTVYSNGGDPRSYGTSTDWTAVFPGKRPFDLGDSFTAEAELCGDVSPLSTAVSAVDASSTLPVPVLNPATVYVGQELVTVENIVHGALVSISEASFGSVGEFTWPVSWFPDYDIASRLGHPLSSGDQLSVSQNLCTAGPTVEIAPPQECRELPAPRIRHPLVGDMYVVVTESVPGARIRIYDSGGIELGDGSGTIIVLNRALTGADTITVVQQVGQCTSGTGYLISARNPDSSNKK